MITNDSSSWIAFLSGSEAAEDDVEIGVRLVTRDADFRHFARIGGLRLAV